MHKETSNCNIIHSRVPVNRILRPAGTLCVSILELLILFDGEFLVSGGVGGLAFAGCGFRFGC